jgi:acyl dehydratase
MKQFNFKNVSELAKYLLQNGTFTINSKHQKLRKWNVLLMCIATGDFNPAHCQPGFAKHSIFGTMVSHGIGTLARAEAVFLQEVQFTEIPVEVIALGLESKYRAALPIGSVYYYKFTISNMVSKKNRWDMDCEIQCIIVNSDGSEKMIAHEVWHPSFVDHSNNVPLEKLELLRPKSYLASLWDIFITQPANKVAIGLCMGVGVLTFASIAFFCFDVVHSAVTGAPPMLKEDIFAYCM